MEAMTKSKKSLHKDVCQQDIRADALVIQELQRKCTQFPVQAQYSRPFAVEEPCMKKLHHELHLTLDIIV